MSTPRTPSEVFLALVHGVAGGRREDLADLADLYAERTHVEHPFHPLRPAPLRTRDELREHFGGGDRPALSREPVDIRIHQTTDPEVIVAEFAYAGTNLDTGESFRIPGIFVMRVRDGQIVESRDYFDPLAAARARGQLAELLSQAGTGTTAG